MTMASRLIRPATTLTLVGRVVRPQHFHSWTTHKNVLASSCSPKYSMYEYSVSHRCISSTASTFNSEFEEGPNPGLESVISQGMTSLEQTATEVQTKTKKASLSASSPRKSTTTHRQLAESQRILDVATDCLEALVERDPLASSLLAIGGEPIVLLDVQVNSNARQAKVFWTLPYAILTDRRLTPTVYRTLVAKLQQNLEKHGGGKLLARQVHTRLRSYYPPRLKYHAAPPSMVAQAMEDLMEE